MYVYSYVCIETTQTATSDGSCRKGARAALTAGGCSSAPAGKLHVASRQPTGPHTTVSQRLRRYLRYMLIGKG